MSLIFIVYSLMLVTSGSESSESSHGGYESFVKNAYNFDVIGIDFMNTQTTKLCLLARLNASIEFSYKLNNESSRFFIPRNATNSPSYCDFNFTSLLQLDFESISFSLIFKRDHMERSETAPVYCNKCDGGHWRLEWLIVSVEDISTAMKNVPPTKIIAKAHASDLSEVPGGFISHISLQRGYRCTDQVLSASLTVTEEYDYSRRMHTMDDWTVHVHIHSIEIQPFLVTNDIVKDPLLCRDVTASIALIIVVPILYFVVFIMICRLKDKKNFDIVKERYFTRNSKKSQNSSETEKLVKKSQTVVSVTCTSPDEEEMKFL